IGLGAASTAVAQPAMEPANFGVERFQLSMDRNGLFGVEWAEAPGNLTIDAALWIGYANNPLVVYQGGTPGERGDEFDALVGDRGGGAFVASVSPLPWLQLGMELPLVIYQDRPTSQSIAPMGLESLSSFGLANIRLMPKLTLVHQRSAGIGIALIPAFTLPTLSTQDAYFGDRGAVFAPELAISRSWPGWRFGMNLGYRVRERAEFLNQIVDDELFGRAGLGYRFGDDGGPKVGLDLTVSAATAARAPFSTFNENYLEIMPGISYLLTNLQIFGGMGAGLRNGVGTPDWRALAGLRFVFGEKSADDPDHDGLLGAADQCPGSAEDKDGFEDGDGCIDPDDDKDGILDVADACRTEPEDKDAFKDEDGCPEPDNDADGVLDLVDTCPLEPEDKDAFKDDDGCPDPDNDADGILDLADKCPIEPEDKDAFQDDDGCPELDNDGDTILDTVDTCPLQAGPADNRGCPDADRDGDTVVDRLDNCPDEKGSVDNAGCAKKQLVQITDAKLVILESVYFKTNLAVIEKRSFALLDNVASVLISHDKLRIQVEGHTDSEGNDAYNKKLSQRRAEAVVAYLTKKRVDKARLEAMGYGEDKPIADNKNKEGRAQNRRVVFTILSGGANVKTTEQGADDDTK
ncbi:MAG: OmpA family protein, partial [Deltaproteobacteria bacterium]|nr:OmpA family protein [Deltaproteobacteria bacterium]